MLMTLPWKKTLIVGLSFIALLAATLVVVYVIIQPPRYDAPKAENRTFSNVTIWNPGSPPAAQQTLTIADGVIAEINPHKDSDPQSPCDRCFAMPGLIDAHIHTPPSLAIGNRALFSLLYLQHGVTAVRDLGQFDDDLPNLVKQLNSGAIAGPRMYYCGPILDGDPPRVPGAILIRTAEEAKAAVDNHAHLGVDCIKVYDNLSKDAFKGVEEKAKQLGLPLIGHTPHALSFREIQNFESQHYTGIPYLDKPAPKGWAYKSQDLIDMTEDEINTVLDIMHTNNISFLPTNANGMSRLTVSDPVRFPASKGFEKLPEFWKRAWPSIVSYPKTQDEIDTELAALPIALSFIRKAHQRGVDVLVGTDVIMPYVIPGESLFQQLKLMSQALNSDEAALRAATQINGAHIDPGKIGVIAVGAHADLLLFKNDPRGDLEAIKHWDFALVGGRLYAREDVDAAVDRYARHVRSGPYAVIMNTAYGFLAGDYEDSEVAKH